MYKRLAIGPLNSNLKLNSQNRQNLTHLDLFNDLKSRTFLARHKIPDGSFREQKKYGVGWRFFYDHDTMILQEQDCFPVFPVKF